MDREEEDAPEEKPEEVNMDPVPVEEHVIQQDEETSTKVEVSKEKKARKKRARNAERAEGTSPQDEETKADEAVAPASKKKAPREKRERATRQTPGGKVWQVKEVAEERKAGE